MKKVWIAVIAVCVIGLCLWFFMGHGDKGDSQKSASGHGKGANGPLPVGVAKATTGPITIFINALGNVTPRNTVTVHTRVDGQLMQVHFQEGQLVKEGDPLADLDARPYIAQLEQAEGQRLRDEALLKEARIDLQRYKLLFSQDSIAKQQVDLQTSLVTQYEGAVKNDQGLVDAAKTQVYYTHITSPATGRVGLRQVDPGNIVHAADTNGIVVVTQLQPITVLFAVPEDNIPAVTEQLQSKLPLEADAWDRANTHQLATGKLIALDNLVDPTTGTVKFRGEFPNQDNQLFPSQFVNIRLKLKTLEDQILVPSAALQRGTQGTFVYLVKTDNTVAVTPITVGVTQGDTISVTKGLHAGDTVVVDGSDGLRDGAKIEIPAQKKNGTPTPPPGVQNQDADPSNKAVHHKHHHGDDSKAQ